MEYFVFLSELAPESTFHLYLCDPLHNPAAEHHGKHKSVITGVWQKVLGCESLLNDVNALAPRTEHVACCHEPFAHTSKESLCS